MLKSLLFSGLICALIATTSCKHAQEDTEAPLAPGMIRISLGSVGINATIDVPDTEKSQHVVEALPSGDIHVMINKGMKFNILINVSGMDMDRKKKDIAGNDVDKFQSWVAQDSNSVLYKTQMVNEEFHFYSIVKKGGKTFYVGEQAQGSNGDVYNYTQAEAKQMYDASKTLTPEAPAPAPKA